MEEYSPVDWGAWNRLDTGVLRQAVADWTPGPVWAGARVRPSAGRHQKSYHGTVRIEYSPSAPSWRQERHTRFSFVILAVCADHFHSVSSISTPVYYLEQELCIRHPRQGVQYEGVLCRQSQALWLEGVCQDLSWTGSDRAQSACKRRAQPGDWPRHYVEF